MSTSSSVCFSACTVWTTSQVRAWVSPSCNESTNVTATKYGPTPRLIGAPPSTSRYRRAGVNLSKQAILLVEDDEDDALLPTRALRKITLANDILASTDGALALDYLFATGDYADLDARELPEIVLLDMKLRRGNGLEVLRRMREDKRTRLLPVIILTSSEEERDIAECYKHGANSVVRKPVDLTRFAEAERKLGCYLLVVNERFF